MQAVCFAAGLGHLGTGAGAPCLAQDPLRVWRQSMGSKPNVASSALAPISMDSDFHADLFCQDYIRYNIRYRLYVYVLYRNILGANREIQNLARRFIAAHKAERVTDGTPATKGLTVQAPGQSRATKAAFGVGAGKGKSLPAAHPRLSAVLFCGRRRLGTDCRDGTDAS